MAWHGNPEQQDSGTGWLALAGIGERRLETAGWKGKSKWQRSSSADDYPGGGWHAFLWGRNLITAAETSSLQCLSFQQAVKAALKAGAHGASPRCHEKKKGDCLGGFCTNMRACTVHTNYSMDLSVPDGGRRRHSFYFIFSASCKDTSLRGNVQGQQLSFQLAQLRDDIGAAHWMMQSSQPLLANPP